MLLWDCVPLKWILMFTFRRHIRNCQYIDTFVLSMYHMLIFRGNVSTRFGVWCRRRPCLYTVLFLYSPCLVTKGRWS